MTVDGPQAGGVVAVYSLPTNIGMFDMTAALDPDLSDGARGLLWRILALNERHVRLYGETNPFRIWQKELVGGAPGGLLAVRGYLRELATCGYVRRWKEQDEQGQFRWVTEAAAVRAFDGDNLREEIAVVDVTKPKVKRTRKPKAEGESKPKKSVAKPGFHDLHKWLADPNGGDTIVPGPQFPRVNRSINEIIEMAIGRGWLVWEEGQDVGDVFTDDMVFYVQQCWKWIKDNSPYKGKLDIHNVAAKLNEWWNVEGKAKYGSAAEEAPVYQPVTTGW